MSSDFKNDDSFWVQLGKEIQKMGAGKTTYASTTNNGSWYCTGTNNGVGFIMGEVNGADQFIPTKIIYNCPATICYFPDGTKTVVKVAEDEEFIKEEGVMACIMKKLFKSRNQFKKLVESGYENAEAGLARGEHNAFLFESRDI